MRIDRAFLIGASVGGTVMFIKKKKVFDGVASFSVCSLLGMTLYNVHTWRAEQRRLFDITQENDLNV